MTLTEFLDDLETRYVEGHAKAFDDPIVVYAEAALDAAVLKKDEAETAQAMARYEAALVALGALPEPKSRGFSLVLTWDCPGFTLDP